MNLKELREMIALMNEHNLTEIEVEREGLRIKLKKGTGGITESIVYAQAPGAAPAAVQSVETPAAAAARAEELAGRFAEVKAPMVGTFYRAPSPEAPPFVNVGETVEMGQVICIIEAMKLMNEIKSEVKGKVVEILVENGHPVEFGQVLFRIEPS